MNVAVQLYTTKAALDVALPGMPATTVVPPMATLTPKTSWVSPATTVLLSMIGVAQVTTLDVETLHEKTYMLPWALLVCGAPAAR